MPIPRGLISSAIVTSTITMVVCSAAWGAFGVLSFADADTLSTAAHRYLCIMLATATLGAVMVYLAARIIRTVRAVAEVGADGYAAGYAAGYADGVGALPGAAPSSPAVSRLPTRR